MNLKDIGSPQETISRVLMDLDQRYADDILARCVQDLQQAIEHQKWTGIPLRTKSWTIYAAAGCTMDWYNLTQLTAFQRLEKTLKMNGWNTSWKFQPASDKSRVDLTTFTVEIPLATEEAVP